jgi:hypothetical protein
VRHVEEDLLMKRMLCLALVATALSAARARAEGPGVGLGLFGWWGNGGQKFVPGVVGPWYNYWPLEAHFQVPAHPQYPFWYNQTLPNGAPVAAPAYSYCPQKCPGYGPPGPVAGAPAPNYPGAAAYQAGYYPGH